MQKKRNTESRNYWISANRFTSNEIAFDVMGTDTVVFSGNTKLFVGQNYNFGDRIDNIDTSRDQEFLDIDYQKDDRLKMIRDTLMAISFAPKGKQEMRITEWGPYDFRYPIIWLKNIDSTGLYYFEILGPKGNWQVDHLNGFEVISKGETGFPSYITAKADNSVAEKKIQLKYTGASYVDRFGKREDSVAAHAFAYREFQPLSKWNVSWYKWDAAHDPAKEYTSFIKLFDETPVYTSIADKIDYTWWGKIGKDLPADSFATVATTKMFLEENTYQIGITADDYVKVFIDGKEVIDAWDPKYTELDENTHHRINIKLNKGEHNFQIIHAEKTGLATLQFYIQPVNSEK